MLLSSTKVFGEKKTDAAAVEGLEQVQRASIGIGLHDDDAAQWPEPQRKPTGWTP